MTKHKLLPYKANNYPYNFNAGIVVQCDSIELTYLITGDTSKIITSAISDNPQRIIGLWESTCFEFFIRKNDPKEYMEFNFSPSLDWNCFEFRNNIDQLTQWSFKGNFKINFDKSSNQIEMKVIIPKSVLFEEFKDLNNLNYSLTAVLKSNDGKDEDLSYWAITHKDERPNFHHPDSFVEYN